MDNHEKNMILDKRDDGRKEQHHNASGRKNRSQIVGKERIEKKMTTSATKEFEKASLGEGSNGVVGNPTTQRVS
mgnify:CR=1 FL=1